MLKYLRVAVRILSSIILIYFINKQAGLATASFAGLMFLYVELNDYIRKQHTETLKEINKFMDSVIKIMKKQFLLLLHSWLQLLINTRINS